MGRRGGLTVSASSPLLDRLAGLVGQAVGVPAELEGVVAAALERNARNGVVLDLRGLSDATDYFVILSGDSDVHTRAIADNVLERTRERGIRAAGVEGRDTGRWILIDFINVVVHIFLPQAREYYRLGRLWGDAPRATLDDL